MREGNAKDAIDCTEKTRRREQRRTRYAVERKPPGDSAWNAVNGRISAPLVERAEMANHVAVICAGNKTRFGYFGIAFNHIFERALDENEKIANVVIVLHDESLLGVVHTAAAGLDQRVQLLLVHGREAPGFDDARAHLGKLCLCQPLMIFCGNNQAIERRLQRRSALQSNVVRYCGIRINKNSTCRARCNAQKTRRYLRDEAQF